MTTDIWNGSGDWSFNPAEWSLGSPPTASELADIATGAAGVHGPAAAAGLTVESGASLQLYAGSGLTVTGALDSAGSVRLLSGGVATIGGGLANSGTLDIGNISIAAATTLRAATLSNTGLLIVEGNGKTGTAGKASLVLSGAAPATLTGKTYVDGDATLQFGDGGVTKIAAGALLGLNGAGARILTAGGTRSALSGLAKNKGQIYLAGETSGYAGDATLTTTGSFTNAGSVYVHGGSVLTFGGTLTNGGAGYLIIGNALNLAASMTVHATTLVNKGNLLLQGNPALGTHNAASLVLSGAAPATLTGFVSVAGDAVLQFGSGQIASIGRDLELFGAGAKVLTDGGSASALSGLTANAGFLSLAGGSVYGAGGVALATTTAFANSGYVYVDYLYSRTGGSSASFGGRLTNTGHFLIGNSALAAATTVTATALTNAGTLILAGSSGSRAELVVDGPASTSGDLTIGTGAELAVTGGRPFTQAGGATTVTGLLVAPKIRANGGLLDFKSAIAAGDGVGALVIGPQGRLEFDAAVDATHPVRFGAAGGALALGDAGAFDGAVSHFAGSDAIDLLGETVTGLAYSGSSASGILTVTGSGGAIAHLSLVGDYSTASFTFGSDGHGGSNILHA